MPWYRNRALLGYLLLLVVLVVALELHHERDDARIRDVQRSTCSNAQQIVFNQRLVLTSLINLRVAALSSPYLRVEARRELVALQAALRSIEDPEDPCESLSD